MDVHQPSDGTFQKLFDSPGDVAAGTFELGLALGGTVSAGAYTAGVLDFLVEALDGWAAQRAEGGVPTHRAIVRFISGASGGGVCTAIFARAMNFDFPHVSEDTQPGVAAENPFFDVWVNHLNLMDMLNVADLNVAGATITSLLNSQAVDSAAAAATNFTGSARAVTREWLANPLRIFLTLTNLNGMPYRLDFGSMTLPDGTSSALKQDYVSHADYARFAVVYGSGTLGADGARPDEFAVGFGNPNPAGFVAWSEFGQYALATAAFPVGFNPRTLTRPLAHYQYRLNDEPPPRPPSIAGGVPHYYPLVPDWDAIQLWNEPAGGGVPENVTFTFVDGGVCDNEPVELVRSALAGISGTNERNGDRATRAVLMIDPFAGNATMTPALQPDVLSSVSALVTTLTQQIRFDTRDVLLAANPDIFSRFMITAQRGEKVGDDALATAGLGAFIGFACRDFRRHDYLLGRQNCQSYLRSFLVLPVDNPLFDGWRNAAFAAEYAVTDESGAAFLPIIPLTGGLRTALPDPVWPAGALQTASFQPALEARFGRLLSREFSKGPLSDVLTWLINKVGDGPAAEFVITAMNQTLSEWELA